MGCQYCQNCGGCCFRELSGSAYQEMKINKLKNILSVLDAQDYVVDNPVFIDDGTRRRASLAFKFGKNQVSLGFNENKSDNIVDCTYCPLLTEKININLGKIREFLLKLCAFYPFTISRAMSGIRASVFSYGASESAAGGEHSKENTPSKPMSRHARPKSFQSARSK